MSSIDAAIIHLLEYKESPNPDLLITCVKLIESIKQERKEAV